MTPFYVHLMLSNKFSATNPHLGTLRIYERYDHEITFTDARYVYVRTSNDNCLILIMPQVQTPHCSTQFFNKMCIKTLPTKFSLTVHLSVTINYFKIMFYTHFTHNTRREQIKNKTKILHQQQISHERVRYKVGFVTWNIVIVC